EVAGDAAACAVAERADVIDPGGRDPAVHAVAEPQLTRGPIDRIDPVIRPAVEERPGPAPPYPGPREIAADHHAVLTTFALELLPFGERQRLLHPDLRGAEDVGALEPPALAGL